MERGFKTWCENTAIQFRKDLIIRSFDPLSPRLLANTLEIKVLNADEVPGLDAKHLNVLINDDKKSWSAVTIVAPNRSLIILNPAHQGGRVNSNLMHELAHIIIGHKAARIDPSENNFLNLDTYSKGQEDEADWLAGCLLLPRKALEHIMKTRIPFEKVKNDYGVSKPMYDYRVRITGVNRQFKYIYR